MITVHDVQARRERNRRQYPRFPYCVPLHFQICTAQDIGDVRPGYAINLSQGGMSFVTTGGIPLSSFILIDMERQILERCVVLHQIMHDAEDNVLAKVIRVNKHKHDEHYCVGMKFISCDEETREDVAHALVVIAHTVTRLDIPD